jgi:hypothetical protein
MKSSKAVLRTQLTSPPTLNSNCRSISGRTVFARAKSSLLIIPSTEASGSDGRHFRKEIHSTAMANGTRENHP